jgi:hypothetical protein
LPQTNNRQKDYTERVRYYTTKPMNGATVFKCTFCDHTVTTLDFDNQNGNRRTQAASAMNRHADLLHISSFRRIEPAKQGSYGAL